MSNLTFGVNPFDRCPDKIGRYHVVDSKGFIRSKSQYGFTSDANAYNLSEKEPGLTFQVVDTRYCSEYVAYRNGEELEGGR